MFLFVENSLKILFYTPTQEDPPKKNKQTPQKQKQTNWFFSMNKFILIIHQNISWQL